MSWFERDQRFIHGPRGERRRIEVHARRIRCNSTRIADVEADHQRVFAGLCLRQRERQPRQERTAASSQHLKEASAVDRMDDSNGTGIRVYASSRIARSSFAGMRDRCPATTFEMPIVGLLHDGRTPMHATLVGMDSRRRRNAPSSGCPRSRSRRRATCAGTRHWAGEGTSRAREAGDRISAACLGCG